MSVPVWHGDYDTTRTAGSASSVAVTFAAIPSDDELILLSFMCGDETEAEPVWPTGFTSLGNQESGLSTSRINRIGWCAYKIASSEGSATYTVTPNGGGNFPASNDTNLAGTIITGVDTTNPFGPYVYIDNGTSIGDVRIGPLDVPYTDTMIVGFVLADGLVFPSVSEFNTSFTRVSDTSIVWGHRTQTAAFVLGNVILQTNIPAFYGLISIRGTGSVASGYLGDHVGNAEIGGSFDGHDAEMFEAGFTQGNDLDAHADWSSYQITASGVQRVDEHWDHKQGQVIDMSTTGYEWSVHSTALSGVNQWAGLTFLPDVTVVSPGDYNIGGVFLRLQTGTAASTMDGYLVHLQRENNGSTTYLRIYRVTDAALTQIATSSDLSADFGAGRTEPCRIHARIDGDIITGYVDGVSEATYDISGDGTKYDTGSYTGITLGRGHSATDSQPFVDDFVAGVLPASLVVEQEGFRFRTDSGNEATPTWEAAQDTNVTMPVGVTKGLRVLIDYTGDPPSATPKLQYRKVGTSTWKDLA